MKNILPKATLFLFTFFVFTSVYAGFAAAQNARPEPELSVSGFRLGDEETAKRLLGNYAPRYDNERGQPKYLFYNEYGNQVMSLTAYSKERPHLIVAIEVFAVGKSYQNKHYQMKDKSFFETESSFFIGARQSAGSMIFGAANVTGPKEVIKKKGAPDDDEKNDKTRILRYRFNRSNESEPQKVKIRETTSESSTIDNSKSPVFDSYTAEYRFVKNELRRFMISLETVNSGTPIF